MYAPAGSKNAAYRIEDPFLRFWFRYVFKNAALVELGKFERLRKLADDDYAVFSGIALERYFYWKFAEDSDYTRMGGWWDRKGENEIDLVCENESSRMLDFYEVKRDRLNINLAALERKAERFFEKHPEKASCQRRFLGLSLEEM